MRNEDAVTGCKKKFGSLEMISLNRIDSVGYLRQIFDESTLLKLALNIESNGLKRPILVEQIDEYCESYQLLAGKLRLEACIRLGWETIPAIVFKNVEIETVKESLIDNLTHKKFTSVELANGFSKLASSGMTRNEMCSTFQVSKSSISELIRIADIDKDILEKCIKNGQISRRFLTRLSKFGKNEIGDAYQHFCEHGVLPSERNVNNELNKIKRSAEKLINHLCELTKNCPEEVSHDLGRILEEARINIENVVMITGTYH